MKKILLLLYCIGILGWLNAQDQRFSAGVKLGLSSSQVSGDDLAGFHKAGLAAGLFSSVKFSNKWSGRFELLFVQKGSKHVGNPEAGDLNYYRLQLNYMEVPVLIQYQFKKLTIEAGPGFGYLIHYREEDSMGDVTGIRPFNKSEISYNLGVNYRIINHMGVNARFSNSISSIRDHASGAHTLSNPGQQNTVLQLAILLYLSKYQ